MCLNPSLNLPEGAAWEAATGTGPIIVAIVFPTMQLHAYKGHVYAWLRAGNALVA